MIKIFNTPWHVAHQYELYKVPDTQWYHIVNTVRRWGKYRPTPENLKKCAYYEPGFYDVAVLHLDQQCVDPTFGKSRLFMELKAEIGNDVPIIVINHGTPYWPEVMDEAEIIRRMRTLLEGTHVVYNSHRAKDMWEKDGPMGISARTIIHGMDETEWWDRPKEPRVFTTLSPAGLNRYYNRTLLSEVQAELKTRGIAHIWVGGQIQFEGFDDYRDFISRSLVYFNPTLESPMPRSRTEAMMSGACVVTLGNHGAEDFIKQGVNGFLVPNNPKACADVLEHLVNDYHTALRIGKRGKRDARELFSAERFRRQWTQLLSEVSGKTL